MRTGHHRQCILVTAYNRPVALRRLLQMLSQQRFHATDLILQIDNDGSEKCHAIASSFTWPYGRLIINLQQENVGLKTNIINGMLAASEYDSVLFLEDDLLISEEISKFFNNQQIIEEIFKINKLFAISLSTPFYDEINHNFMECYFGTSNIIMAQVPSSWGVIFNGQALLLFISEFQKLEQDRTVELPKRVNMWSDNSWKKTLYKYLKKKDLYFAYFEKNYVSITDEQGAHYKGGVNELRKVSVSNVFEYPRLEEKLLHYDMYFEVILQRSRWPKPVRDIIPASSNLVMDLNGSKCDEFSPSQFIATTQKQSKPELRIERIAKSSVHSFLIGQVSERGTLYIVKGKNFERGSNLYKNRITSENSVSELVMVISSRVLRRMKTLVLRPFTLHWLARPAKHKHNSDKKKHE